LDSLDLVGGSQFNLLFLGDPKYRAKPEHLLGPPDMKSGCHRKLPGFLGSTCFNRGNLNEKDSTGENPQTRCTNLTGPRALGVCNFNLFLRVEITISSWLQ